MKIEFHDVELKNFLACGDVVQSISFKQGINLINGPNGVGKTTAVDSISFALFGKTPREDKQEDLINWKNRKDCLVVLRLSKGPVKYKIVRGLKPNILKLYVGEEDILERLDKRDSQAALEDILGIDYSVFSNLIYTNVNDFTPILKMTKPQKRAFIEKLFNIEIFTKLGDKCKDKIKNADKRLIELSADKKAKLALISEYRKILEDLKIDTKSSVKDEIEELKVKIKDLKKEFSKIDISTLTDDVLDHRVKITELTQEENANKNSLSTAKSLKEEFKTQLEKLTSEGAESSVKDEIEDLEIKIDALKEILKLTSLPDLEDEIQEKKAELDSLKEKLKSIEKSIDSLEHDIKSDLKEARRIEDKISLLEENEECPTCDQKVDKEYVTKKFGKELKTLDNKITKDKKKVEKIQALEYSTTETAIDLLKMEIDRLQDKFDDLKATEIELNNKTKVLVSLNRIDDQEEKGKEEKVNKIKELKELIYQKESAIADYTSRLEKYSKKRKELETEIEAKTEEITQYNTKKTEFDNKTKELESLQRILEKEEKDKEASESKKQEYNKQIKQLEDESKELENETKKLNSVLDYLTYIKDLCKDDKIKTHAISANLPLINKFTNDYLEQVGFRFFLEIDKFIDAKIKGPGIFGSSVSNLSGGEGRSVDLALTLALHDIMVLKAKNKFDILFMDEVLDSSVDGSNIMKIFDIIKAKQEKENLKVYVISHRPEIQDLEFNQMISVKMEKGYSKITEV